MGALGVKLSIPKRRRGKFSARYVRELARVFVASLSDSEKERFLVLSKGMKKK